VLNLSLDEPLDENCNVEPTGDNGISSVFEITLAANGVILSISESSSLKDILFQDAWNDSSFLSSTLPL